MKINHLYVDELGNPNPKSQSHKYFIFCACVFPDGLREQAKVYANQIKFKYWGKQQDYQNIIFHSNDIGRKSGAFSIFQNDPARYDEFIADLFKLLKLSGITIFVNVTDLAAARKQNWDMNTVLNQSSTHITSSFVHFLLASQSKGKMFLESATDIQNAFFLKAFSFYLSPNAIPKINYKNVQQALTSISFVTKNNHDIEEQIADLFAYAARCKYEKEELGTAFAPSSYEYRIVRILEKKLFSTPVGTTPAKKRLFNKIEAYKVLTK